MLNMLEYKGADTLYVIEIPLMDYWHTEYFCKIPWVEFRKIKFSLDFKGTSVSQIKRHVIKQYTVRESKYTDDEIEKLPAGVSETLYNLIMELSDSGTLGSKPEDLNMEKLQFKIDIGRLKARRSIDLHMFTVICSVFRGYTFEQLEKLPFDRICELFGSAEKHMLETGILQNPIEFFAENSQEKEDEEEKDMKTAFSVARKKIESAKREEQEQPKDDNELLFKQLAAEAKRLAETKEEEEEPIIVKRQEAKVERELPEVETGNKWEREIKRITGDDTEVQRFRNFYNTLLSEITPVQIHPNHPNREKLQGIENERVNTIIERNIEGYIEAKRSGKFYSTQGLRDEDFVGHNSYEEMVAEAADQRVKPAGQEIIDIRNEEEKRRKEEATRREIEDAVGGIANGKKRLSAKDLKKLKELKSKM